jgi:DNA-binding response OmpR family regulator
MKRYKIETVVLNDVRLVSWVRGKFGSGTLTYQKRKRVKKPVVPGELTFHNETNTIIWTESSVSCTPATFQLVFQLWETTERFLSKETMKEVVMDDEEAQEHTVRERVRKARKELRDAEFPYEIETVRGKGYRLVRQQ